jgi:hypothetical protein
VSFAAAHPKERNAHKLLAEPKPKEVVDVLAKDKSKAMGFGNSVLSLSPLDHILHDKA